MLVEIIEWIMQAASTHKSRSHPSCQIKAVLKVTFAKEEHQLFPDFTPYIYFANGNAGS